MLANINLIEQNKIEVPKEVQFYIKNESSLYQKPSSQAIVVSKELKDLVQNSGLFKEEDKLKFILKP
jgi:hypothetical protein